MNEAVVEASALRLRRRTFGASAVAVESLEGGEGEKREKGAFDVDVDELVEDPDRPQADELLEEVHPHPLEAVDVEEVEDVFPEAVEMGERRLLHHLRTSKPA